MVGFGVGVIVGVGVAVGVGVEVGVLVGVGVKVTFRKFSWADNVICGVVCRFGKANEKSGVQSQTRITTTAINPMVDQGNSEGTRERSASLATEIGRRARFFDCDRSEVLKRLIAQCIPFLACLL